MSLKNCLVNDFASWHVQKRNKLLPGTSQKQRNKVSRDTDDEAQQCNDDEGINGFLELSQQRAQGFLGQLETSSDPRPDGDPAVNKSAKSPFFSRSMFSLNTEIHQNK